MLFQSLLVDRAEEETPLAIWLSLCNKRSIPEIRGGNVHRTQRFKDSVTGSTLKTFTKHISNKILYVLPMAVFVFCLCWPLVRLEDIILEYISENVVIEGSEWFNSVAFWSRYLLQGGIKLADARRVSIITSTSLLKHWLLIFTKTEEQTIQDWGHKPEPVKQVCYLVGRRQSITKPSIEGGERTQWGQNIGQWDALAMWWRLNDGKNSTLKAPITHSK